MNVNIHFNKLNKLISISAGFGRFSVYTHFGRMCFIIPNGPFIQIFIRVRVLF